MRGSILDLASPHPVGERLPALYQEDEFAQRFVSAFDDGLAPVISCLDNIDAYFDPSVAPDDFVEWLGGWVGLAVDETWSHERRRALVARAATLYGRRGIVRGLQELMAVFAGSEPEIEDNGGVAWSTSPGCAIPGSPEPRLKVVIHSPTAPPEETQRLRALVDLVKPAHVPAEVKIITT